MASGSCGNGDDIDYNDEDISVACKGLHNGINRLLNKYEKKKQVSIPESVKRRSTKLVKHVEYLLQTLSKKRQSLKTLLEYFRIEWMKCCASSTSGGNSNSKLCLLEEYPLPVLSYFMQLFLRCQDGLVILTSGECRHPGDIEQLAKSKSKNYQSQLSTLELRNDGYTTLYKSDATYSGYGYDEYINEHVGLQHRLCKLLSVCFNGNTKKVWDYLVEHGGEGIDTLLDQHETEMKEFQSKLHQQIKNSIVKDIHTNLHPQKVTFITQDKIERLVVVMSSGKQKKIVLERRANIFQIHDPCGVLPSKNCSIDNWKQAIPIPTMEPTAATTTNTNESNNESKKKKRRVIIDDSDSDEDARRSNDSGSSRRASAAGASAANTANVKTAATDGLVVKVEIAKSKTVETEESVTTIRTQMGMNVAGLELSREELELEQRQDGSGCSGTNSSGGGSSAMKEQQQEEAENADHQLIPMINRGKQKLRRLTSILKQVQSRSMIDENEVWDARECLRQAYMAVGNDLLWSNSSPSSDSSLASTTRLEEALNYFKQASNLVKQQQDAQIKQGEGTNDSSTVESRYVQRNLLLLKGQADVNCGIVLVEWSQLKETKPAAKIRYLNRAISVNDDASDEAEGNLRSAQKFAVSMRRHAKKDQEKFGKSSIVDWVDSMIDILKADQLESLTSRWIGTTIWHQKVTILQSPTSANRCQQQPQQQYYNKKQVEDAIYAFDRSTSFFFSHSFQHTKLQNHPNLLQSLLEVGSECMLGCSTIADLACSTMESLGFTAKQKVGSGSSIQYLTKEHVKGDELLTIVQKALKKQASICDAFDVIKSKSQLLASAVHIFQEESEIPKGDDIRQSLLDIETWWSNKKSQQIKARELLASSSSASSTRSSVDSHLPRSDLFALGGGKNSGGDGNKQQP